MMDEINDESEFEIEGPLWIQVHAMSGGIEVTVTRAQMSDDGEPIDSPFGMGDPRKFFPNDGELFGSDEEDVMPTMNNGALECLDNVFVFKEFDEIIPLASRMAGYIVNTSLYSYDNHYYLHVTYEDETMDEERKADLFSVVSEFGMPSNLTIHRLKEYGKVVMDSDVFTKMQHFFGTE